MLVAPMNPVFKAAVLVCLCVFVGTFSVRAQAPSGARPIQVFAAAAFVNQGPGVRFSVNEQIKVKARPGAIDRLRSTTLQVRVFRGTAEYLASNPWTEVGDCYLYLSTVHPVRISSAGDEVTIEGAVVNLWWLQELNGKVQGQEWLFVLEDRSFTGREIKLKKTEVWDYFKMGYVFVASPGNRADEEAAMLRSWFKESHAQVDLIRRQAQQTADCLTYRASNGERLMLAALPSC